MSSLARYFHALGKDVGGYDRSSSEITESLADLGMEINFRDMLEDIPVRFFDSAMKDSILIIYTPAIPENSIQLNYFFDNSFCTVKRAEVLGEISKAYKTLAISGSHGKTTISAMVAEVFRAGSIKGSAFLGGISKNINSNLLLRVGSNLAVMEADEFDKSFLFLHPDLALVSSMDPDHLDIYGDTDHLRNSFEAFLKLLPEAGIAIIKEGLDHIIPTDSNICVKFYGLESGRDYHAESISLHDLSYEFDLMTPSGLQKGFCTAVPGWINIENAIGAAAICLETGIPVEIVRKGISSFNGIKRRFDLRLRSEKLVYIDDYAHHPNEIKSFLASVSKLFPGKKITGVFQPHLFSRTRDFAQEFGKELSKLDELILLDIYPAREEPMEGVTSGLILDEVDLQEKELVSKEELLKKIENRKPEVLVTMGAGDIDQLVKPIEELLGKYAS